jgi:hypothetical protein
MVTSPFRPHTSMVVKSTAASTSQCAFKNVFQVVFRLRSGAGSMPCALRMLPTLVSDRSRVARVGARARRGLARAGDCGQCLGAVTNTKQAGLGSVCSLAAAVRPGAAGCSIASGPVVSFGSRTGAGLPGGWRRFACDLFQLVAEATRPEDSPGSGLEESAAGSLDCRRGRVPSPLQGTRSHLAQRAAYDPGPGWRSDGAVRGVGLLGILCCAAIALAPTPHSWPVC